MNTIVSFDRYVLDTLMRDLVGHDHRPSAFLVYAFVLGQGRTTLSHAAMAEATGLSKRSVQDALRHLERRGLIHVTRNASTEPVTIDPLSPWRARASTNSA